MDILEKVVMNKKIGIFTSLLFGLMLHGESAFASSLSQLEQMAQNAKQGIETSAMNALQNNDNKLVGRGEDEKINLPSLV